MKHQTRNPVSVRKENLMGFGMLLCAGSMLLGYAITIAAGDTIEGVRRAAMLFAEVFTDLMFIAGMIMVSLQVPNTAIKVLILIGGSVAMTLSAYQALVWIF